MSVTVVERHDQLEMWNVSPIQEKLLHSNDASRLGIRNHKFLRNFPKSWRPPPSNPKHKNLFRYPLSLY